MTLNGQLYTTTITLAPINQMHWVQFLCLNSKRYRLTAPKFGATIPSRHGKLQFYQIEIQSADCRWRVCGGGGIPLLNEMQPRTSRSSVAFSANGRPLVERAERWCDNELHDLCGNQRSAAQQSSAIGLIAWRPNGVRHMYANKAFNIISKRRTGEFRLE